MVTRCVPDPDPWRGVQFAPVRTKFVRATGNQLDRPTDRAFFRSCNTLPDVVFWNILPTVTTRHPCCARHVDRPWLASSVVFYTWGVSTVVGTARGTQPGIDLQVVPSTDPILRREMASEVIRGPAVAESADPGDRFAWMDARATVVQYALLAQLYIDSADPVIRENPLLARHAAAWTTRAGVVHALPVRGFELTDPRTY